MLNLMTETASAGGGMMLLLVLTSFLGYPMHLAVGTSVFIMAFTALTGGVSHFIIGGHARYSLPFAVRGIYVALGADCGKNRQ